MDSTAHTTVPALAGGPAYLLVGTALLLQVLGLLSLRWTVLGSLLLIVVGVLSAVAGTVQARRHRSTE
ncbi:hypothetical protein ACVGVM_12220 [Pseudonocardia bannensis]|uniref:Uncharacterized protein n=1 Tax=Pseudonocardia bannensis TaxID=630973 RepID=A0A848DF24_9PSEU|nr:hypothetical protein [Pseudonocardia bannensis]NMH91232.1 hypothetical protein [Pseudonocardia bannensis]